jgi:uncharacterized protein (UPF0335 family)
MDDETKIEFVDVYDAIEELTVLVTTSLEGLLKRIEALENQLKEFQNDGR